MVRRIIKINEEKCNGCGLCAEACHEGAIALVDGKAKLLREDYCDGFGDCLPKCPTGAISFETREAPAYDACAVLEAKSGASDGRQSADPGALKSGKPGGHGASELAQWPCQIRLVPLKAPYFDGADLLIAADCTAYAYAGIHSDYMRGRVTLIGCPKLDDFDYGKKLAEILRNNDISSVTLLRMEVPCCGGLQRAAEAAVAASGKNISVKSAVISVRGEII